MLENAAGEIDLLWQRINSGASLIAKAVRVKMAIIQEDPFEQGIRTGLYLGHTTSHVLEKISNLSPRHGDEVSLGMLTAAQIAAN